MKVAIVGGAPSSQMLAPFNDPEWEIWVLGNQLDQYDKRVTRVFEIHDYLGDHDPRYPEWLVGKGHPLVVGDKFPIESDLITRYPVEEANKLMGGEYLSSSPAYMIALAILEGYDEISIFGVDMAVDNHEYFKQRPEMYAWIAFAKAKGIKITIPQESCLFKGGYVEGRDWGIKKPDGVFTESQFLAMVTLHENKIAEYEAQKKQIESLIQTHDGARQSYDRLAKVARAVESGVKVTSLTETRAI